MNAQRRPFSPVCCRHRPDQRAVVSEHGHWLFLVHPCNAPDHSARRAQGRLPLQLWSRCSGISILVPSAETDSTYELLVPHRPPQRFSCYHALSEALRDRCGIEPPPAGLITASYTRFVLTAFVGAS